jgi:hypothetical protein
MRTFIPASVQDGDGGVFVLVERKKQKQKNKSSLVIRLAGETYCVVGEQLLAFHMLHAQQHLGPEHMRTKDLPVVEVEVYAQPTHGTVVELRSSPLKNPN